MSPQYAKQAPSGRSSSVNRGYPAAIADEIAMEAQAGHSEYQLRDDREDALIERILQVARRPNSPRRATWN